jgi:hypothetical protein
MPDKQLREHVLYLLRGGGAHLNLDDAVAKLPPALRGGRPKNVPHTPWRLIEHMRIAQWDILEFTRDPNHQSPDFPEGYWPEQDAPPSARAWKQSLDRHHADLAAMQEIVADRSVDLLAKIPHGSGQTVLREALLIADHNAYHLGQLVVVRRALGAWHD